MNEMVERVAAGIMVEAYKTDGMVISLGVAKAIARAAIAAMREPTENMKSTDDDANAIYCAMIDRALK